MFGMGSLGVIAKRRRQYHVSLDYYLQAVQMAEELGDRSTMAVYTGNIGNTYRELGQYEQAIETLRKAAKLDEEAGAPAGVARHLGNIGDTYIAQGKFAEALPYFDEAIPHLRKANNRYFLCWLLVTKAEVLYELGRYEEAHTLNAEGGPMAQETERESYLLRSQNLAKKLADVLN